MSAEYSITKYMHFRYEPADLEGYWRLHDAHETPRLIVDDIIMVGPNTEEMRTKIAAICRAIDAAIELAQES